MKNRKVFCEECRRDVSYRVFDKPMEGVIKGEKFCYNGKYATCTDCGKEVYVEEFHDHNLRALYEEYRKFSGIISLDTILKIPKKYAIGKRPLSRLLGWGELTFSRYCEGDIPTRQYSDVLQRIYDDPRLYNQILEQNKGNLITEIAYRKTKNAINRILGAQTSKLKKTKMDYAIEYLINKCEDITPLALQKALYYTQGFYYAFYGEYLFEETCEAWIHGPVYRDVYYRYRDYRFDPISGSTPIDELKYSPSEKAVLDGVVKHICCYSGKVLATITHLESPWLSAREGLHDTEQSDRAIQTKDIGDYFCEVKETYQMLSPNDIGSYIQDMITI